jgi:hypothetical protein
MTKAQQVFEAIMTAKGHTNFSKSETGKYENATLAMRWPFFKLGWEMRGVAA